MNMNRRDMKLLSALCFTCLANFCYASENEDTIPLVITEPVEIVLLCPDSSQHEGELVPKWVTSDEAIEFFCNDSTEETEVGE